MVSGTTCTLNFQVQPPSLSPARHRVRGVTADPVGLLITAAAKSVAVECSEEPYTLEPPGTVVHAYRGYMFA